MAPIKISKEVSSPRETDAPARRRSPDVAGPNRVSGVGDSDLAKRWMAGSHAAGTALLGRHAPALSRYFRARIPDAADDLMQQTYLVCTQNIHKLADPTKFRAFLLGIARNVLLEAVRRRRDHRVDELRQEPATRDRTPSQVTLLFQQRSALALALESLSPEHEMAVILHYWAGLSVLEIAAVQGVAEGTVKSRLARSRDQLRDYFLRRRHRVRVR